MIEFGLLRVEYASTFLLGEKKLKRRREKKEKGISETGALSKEGLRTRSKR